MFTHKKTTKYLCVKFYLIATFLSEKYRGVVATDSSQSADHDHLLQFMVNFNP